MDKRTREGRREAERQEKLPNCNKGKHEWSSWYCDPSGLARECRICGKSELMKRE
jgi:hypothetical protein